MLKKGDGSTCILGLEKILTSKNIKTGFKFTEIWHFNPRAMDNKMAPSKAFVLITASVVEENYTRTMEKVFEDFIEEETTKYYARSLSLLLNKTGTIERSTPIMITTPKMKMLHQTLKRLKNTLRI